MGILFDLKRGPLPFPLCPFFHKHADHSTVKKFSRDPGFHTFFLTGLSFQRPGDQSVEKIVFQRMASKPDQFPCLSLLLAFSSAFLNQTSRFFQSFVKAVLVQTVLKHIFICAKTHGFFYIFKIIVAAEHDNVDLPVFFPDPSDQLYSIHYRHGKICHKHIYLFFPKEVVGFFTILRIIHDLISCFFPGIQCLKIASHKKIIVCHKCSVHQFLLLSSGIS